MATSKYHEIQFSDSDVVNPDDFIPAGEYNPHGVKGWLFHDCGFVVAVVFADCLQDAIDEAVDANKMDRWKIAEEDYDDYDMNGENPTCCFCGNAGEPFDLEGMSWVELPAVRWSYCAMLNSYLGE